MTTKNFSVKNGLTAGAITLDATTGNANVGNIVVTGKSNLNSIGNVTITGGTNGQVIKTDGNGNLSFATVTGGSGSAAPMPYYVPAGNTVTVDANYQGIFGYPITVDGTMQVDGVLVDVGGNIIQGNGVINVANVSASGNVTGNYILGNGAFLTGISGGGGTPGGSNTQVQFNDAGSFGGNANLVFDKTTGTLTTNIVSATGNIIGGNVITGGIVSATGNITGANATLGSGSTNYHTLTGAATGNVVTHAVAGSDANVSMLLQTQGSGAIDLAAGSKGVNISNGSTVTAITRSATGTLYTSLPSVTISAPTTAGGVQATASATAISLVSLTSIASGGTGYTVGDALTLSGGVFTTAIQFTVTTVSAGAVTGVSVTNFGNYTSIVANPVPCTGGTGTGATFNVSLGVLSLSLGTAGSGYVEQPTVSFSGGGGSGAAAYVTVGSIPKVQTLGSTLQFYTPGGVALELGDSNASSQNYLQVFSGGSGQNGVYLRTAGTNANPNMYIQTKGTGQIAFFTNVSVGTYQQFAVTHTASANRYVQATGGVAGATPPSIGTGGGAEAFAIYSNSNDIRFYTGGVVGTLPQFRIASTALANNYLNVTGAPTGSSPILYPTGTDTNISQVFQTKGTGAIDLAAGSSGVNISNGGTVTAITRTAAGSGYTSIPSVVVTAPTTAGGVQAVVTVAQMQIAGATIQSGGTGYTVGDTLTIVGGTVVTSAATLTVATVSAGVITGVNIGTYTNYTALPTNPVSVTGGTGTGATFNITWAVISFNIGTAGSGYVEQPTVTFSGGGGSGAAAYATIGATTAIRSLSSSSILYTSSGPALQLNSASGGNSVNYVTMTSAIAGGTPAFSSVGTDTNIALSFSSKGASPVVVQTNGFGPIQFQVAHTASAVNYVQVTGAATTVAPVISAQGSDTNINIGISAKGTGVINLNAATRLSFGSTNYVQVAGAATTVAPVISAQGTDTNIDLTLTPKGTGNVTTTANIVATGNVTGGNLSTAGILSTTGNVTFTGANVSLGAVANLKITGGSNAYVLSTDGTGNLSWVAQSGGGGGASNARVMGYNLVFGL